MSLKNRIKGHRRVRVGDLVPHEHNPRVHGDAQREALRALLGEVGFARSLLAYEIDCTGCNGMASSQSTCSHCQGSGRQLKLIDGHLRQSEIDPDEEVEVEILDVTEPEARKLLLSLDPLAQLADFDDAALAYLKGTVETDSQALEALWGSLEGTGPQVDFDGEGPAGKEKGGEHVPESFRLLIDCRDEAEQRALLGVLKGRLFRGWLAGQGGVVQQKQLKAVVENGFKECKALIS